MNTIVPSRSVLRTCGAGFLALALLAGSASAAAFGEADPHGFNDIKQVIAKMPEMTDKNKDGMISRKEYLEMQGRLFDMASKKGMMTMEEFKAFMTEFKTFGQ